ncbi:MAG: hypothetical protein Q8O89_03815 [Nanoarchaeota archaeon]|nr:hypothetical protein [Nanoarchaeota archaeon]
MNQNYQATEIAIKLTDRCGYNCASCNKPSEPSKDALSELDIYRTLKEAKALGFNSAYAHGGEPFLKMNLLEAFISRCRAEKIDLHYLVSGGSAATSAEKVKEQFTKLHKAGLSEKTIVCISIDDFHAENKNYFEKTANFIEGYLSFLKETFSSYSTVLIQSKVVRSKNHDGKKAIAGLEAALDSRALLSDKPSSLLKKIFGRPSLSLKGAEIYFQFSGLVYSGNPDLIPEMISERNKPCFENKIYPANENTLAVDNDGDVKPCFNFPYSFGNVLENTLTSSFESIRRDPIVRFMTENSNWQLLEKAKKIKPELKDIKFVDKCHICDIALSDKPLREEIRENLKRKKRYYKVAAF